MTPQRRRLYGLLCLIGPSLLFLLTFGVFYLVMLRMMEKYGDSTDEENAFLYTNVDSSMDFFVVLFSLEILMVVIGLFSGLYFLTRSDLPEKKLKIASQASKSSDYKVPAGIQGWNWGAAGLSWIWGAKHQVSISFLDLVFPFMLFGWIALGKKGNEWAWSTGNWKSVSAFQAAQTKWRIWGMLLFLPRIFLSTIFGFFVFLLLICTFSGTCSV